MLCVPCQPAVSDVNILDGRDACGDNHCCCCAMQPSLDLLICKSKAAYWGLSLSSGQVRSDVSVVAVGNRVRTSESVGESSASVQIRHITKLSPYLGECWRKLG